MEEWEIMAMESAPVLSKLSAKSTVPSKPALRTRSEAARHLREARTSSKGSRKKTVSVIAVPVKGPRAVSSTPINSRTKGAVGEREFATLLTERGINARRGQQFAGGQDSPDVKTDLSGIHFEVKRVQAGNPYVWLKQAIRDAKSNLPVVAHRKNNQEWIAVLRMKDLIDLLIMREGTML